MAGCLSMEEAEPQANERSHFYLGPAVRWGTAALAGVKWLKRRMGSRKTLWKVLRIDDRGCATTRPWWR
jgi:hypothetical protein